MNLIDLTSKTEQELQTLAAELQPYIGALPKNLGLGKLRDAVEKGCLKRQKKLEQEAADEATRERQEQLGSKGLSRKDYPDPETVAIQHSQKVYVTFLNMENPGQDGEIGADVPFFRGAKYVFHMWDQQRHIMPRCLVVSDPESETALLERMVQYWTALGFKGHHATKQAKEHLHRNSLVNSCTGPRTEVRRDPKTDMVHTVVVGKIPRFQFTEIEPAPADAEFGLVIKEIPNDENTPE